MTTNPPTDDPAYRQMILDQWVLTTRDAVRARAATYADPVRANAVRHLGICLINVGGHLGYVNADRLRDLGLNPVRAHLAVRLGIDLGVIEPEPDDDGDHHLIVDLRERVKG